MTQHTTIDRVKEVAADATNTATNFGKQTAERVAASVKEASAKASSLAADTQKTLGANVEDFSKRLQGVSSFNQQTLEAFAKSSEIAGKAFDRIVIRYGHYLRGRDPEEMVKLLQEGITRAGNDLQVRVIPNGRDAIHHSIKYGRKGELVVTLADLVPEDISYVQEIRDKLLEEQNQESASE